MFTILSTDFMKVSAILSRFIASVPSKGCLVMAQGIQCRLL